MQRQYKKSLTLQLTGEQIAMLADELGLKAQELEVQLEDSDGGLKLLQTRFSVRQLGVLDADN